MMVTGAALPELSLPPKIQVDAVDARFVAS
jgi:hypothetical protein